MAGSARLVPFRHMFGLFETSDTGHYIAATRYERLDNKFVIRFGEYGSNRVKPVHAAPIVTALRYTSSDPHVIECNDFEIRAYVIYLPLVEYSDVFTVWRGNFDDITLMRRGTVKNIVPFDDTGRFGAIFFKDAEKPMLAVRADDGGIYYSALEEYVIFPIEDGEQPYVECWADHSPCLYLPQRIFLEAFSRQ